MMKSECITYHIDSAYRIVYLDALWDSLANENQAGNLLSENIINRSLFDFISDDRMKYLYDSIFEKIWRTGESLKFIFRCDTPDKRRIVELEIYPLGGEKIGVTNRIVQVEERPPVTLLDPASEKNTDFLTVCSWCKKVNLPSEEWVEIEEAVTALALFSQPALPHLTHTICDPCYQQQLEELSD